MSATIEISNMQFSSKNLEYNSFNQLNKIHNLNKIRIFPNFYLSFLTLLHSYYELHQDHQLTLAL